jgi:hypothetical protein
MTFVEASVQDEPNDAGTEYEARKEQAAEEAAIRIKRGDHFLDWLAVGEGLMVGRLKAMRQAGTNQPMGAANNKAFGLGSTAIGGRVSWTRRPATTPSGSATTATRSNAGARLCRTTRAPSSIIPPRSAAPTTPPTRDARRPARTERRRGRRRRRKWSAKSTG